MFVFKKIRYLILFLFVFFALPFLTSAAESTEECFYTLSAKSSSGEFISDVRFELYEQESDVLNRPKPGKLIVSGVSDKILGKASLKVDCEKYSNTTFALKVRTLNNENSNFWYYNHQLSLEKINFVTLSGLQILFRDSNYSLMKNVKFSLYTQKYDADGQAIREKKDLLGSFDTGEVGMFSVHVPQGSIRSFDRKIGDHYVLESSYNGSIFTKYYLKVSDSATTQKNYVYSGLKIVLKDVNGNIFPTKTKIEIYEQLKDAKDNNVLGKKIKDVFTNEKGEALFEYPEGTYALAVQDSLNQRNVFWGIQVTDELVNPVDLKTNLTRFSIFDSSGNKMPVGTSFDIYDLIKASDGKYYQNKKIYSGKISAGGYSELHLSPATYLFVYNENKDKEVISYALALVSKNDKKGDFNLQVADANKIKSGQSFAPRESGSNVSGPATAGNSLAKRLAGRILLRVEGRGEAYYISPQNYKKYYLANGEKAYGIMRFLGIGITNENLAKIPVASDRLSGLDSDGDGLPDNLEIALGSDSFNKDSDGDGFNDYEEVLNGYNPIGSGKIKHDLNFAKKNAGKIFLQVENKGEAWYVNPVDNKRYYLADGDVAYNVMRYLSLGATNINIDSIEEEELSVDL